MAKPFIKWVGGKSQLIPQLEALLPSNFTSWQNVTYIEPFIGGGAMLFYMLKTHSNITRAVINDINADLTTCYLTVRDHPNELIKLLKQIQMQYHALLDEDARRDYYMAMRDRFNTNSLDSIENTCLFIFLNRTCFNGLYRVNRKGLFNVPFGRYDNPMICDTETILSDSLLLQNVEILTGDFRQTINYAQTSSLFYFDPPYRPLSDTSSFNDYSKEAFDDAAQIRLKEFCDEVNAAGHSFMLSNSDPKGKNGDTFFDDLYSEYIIDRVWASRNVNANASKRGKLTEILVHNYVVHPTFSEDLFPDLNI
ncbi:MAG: DNA adenine methylase [Bacteroidales bacterium]|nr:DNA adenine methylase [Bacteroidales bacterium]